MNCTATNLKDSAICIAQFNFINLRGKFEHRRMAGLLKFPNLGNSFVYLKDNVHYEAQIEGSLYWQNWYHTQW
jgi:hypothetical protein